MMMINDYLDHNDHNHYCMCVGVRHNDGTNMVSKYQYTITNIMPMDIQITITININIITITTLKEQEICLGHS